MPSPTGWLLLGLLALPFHQGEHLEFSVRFGVVPAGRLTLQVTRQEVRPQGDTLLEFRMEARTRGLFNALFRVHDRIRSQVVVPPFASVLYEKHLEEGRYRAHRRILYDPERQVAVYENGDTLPTPPGALDPLALYYYLRTVPLRAGDTLRVPYHVDRESTWLRIYVERRDRVPGPEGPAPAWVLTSDLKASGILKGGGDFVLWLSDDGRRLPLRIETSLSFGTMVATLQRVEEGRP